MGHGCIHSRCVTGEVDIWPLRGSPDKYSLLKLGAGKPTYVSTRLVSVPSSRIRVISKDVFVIA